jgi:hypothetical protein
MFYVYSFVDVPKVVDFFLDPDIDASIYTLKCSCNQNLQQLKQSWHGRPTDDIL